MTAPALIIHDRDDPDVPFDQGEEIARAILRDSEVVRRPVEFRRVGVLR